MSDISNLELEERMRLAFEKIPRNKWIYFHKKSMMNFLIHLNQVSPEDERSRIEHIILKYIREVELLQEEDGEALNIERSQTLFNDYVSKIIPTFDITQRFVPVFGRQTYLYIIPLLGSIFYLCWGNALAMTVLLSLLSLYFLRILLKMRKGKIYGFGY